MWEDSHIEVGRQVDLEWGSIGLMLPQQLVEVIRAGQWGRAGRQADSQAHHTEHLWTGFMGESLGQWKARPNSSNWDTLPRTLGWGERPQQCELLQLPRRFVWVDPCPFLSLCPHADTRRGLAAQKGGRAYR